MRLCCCFFFIFGFFIHRWRASSHDCHLLVFFFQSVRVMRNCDLTVSESILVLVEMTSRYLLNRNQENSTIMEYLVQT